MKVSIGGTVVARDPLPQEAAQPSATSADLQNIVSTTINVIESPSKTVPGSVTVSSSSNPASTVLQSRSLISSSNTTATTTSYVSISITSSISLAPSAVLAPSSRPLGHTARTGIAIGSSACLVITILLVIVVYYFRRRRLPCRFLPLSLSRKLRLRTSRSSDSLTSFDTRTDDGEAGLKQLRTQLLSEKAREPKSDVTSVPPKSESATNLVDQEILPATPSDLPATSPQILQSSDDSPIMAGTEVVRSRPQSIVGDLRIFPSFAKRAHSRSRSTSSIPDLTRIRTSFSHSRSASDVAPTHHHHHVSPLQSGLSSLTPLSSSLSPCHDSPHSLASLSLDSSILTRSAACLCEIERDGFKELPATTPVKAKPRRKRDASPLSIKSKSSVTSYLDDKPLPPSPFGPPAPPPPFTPPLPPTPASDAGIRLSAMVQPLRWTRSDNLISSKFARRNSTERGTRPFEELLSRNNSSRTHLTSVASLRKHNRSQSNTHISSMACTQDENLPIQPLKPVLTLDTVNPFVKDHRHKRLHRRASIQHSATTITPTTCAHSAPATLQSQFAPLLNTPAYQAPMLAIDIPHSSLEDPRPISTAATTGSTNPPSICGLSQISDNAEGSDYRVTTLTTGTSYVPPDALLQLTQMVEKSGNEAVPALLTIDPQTSIHHNNSDDTDDASSVVRSPSVSVPIVLRFSFPRSSSQQCRQQQQILAPPADT